MPSPGTLIGSYRIVRLLGEGAMGAVYEAEHTLIERRVAIKLLHRELLEQRTSVQRFLNEARAMSRIRHPGLIEIIELGELAERGPYLVMELLIGETLAARIVRTKRWPPALAIDVALQIANAMTAAHAQGIVHRDLKPSNLMQIATAGSPDSPRIKVLDFGIAKLVPVSRSKKDSDPLTRSQALLGTAEYMAPEQCRDARGVDAQADVYALGVILYELLAGQRPFAAATAVEVMLLHMQAAPPFLKHICPELSDELLALVHKMLAKAPDDRPTMAAVARQLSSDLLHRPRQAGTIDDSLPAKGTLDGVSLVPKTGASPALRRRQALWSLLGVASLLPLFIGSRKYLRSRRPPPQPIAISSAQPASARVMPPPSVAPPPPSPIATKPEAPPPPAPPVEPKPETPPKKDPVLHRPAIRPPTLTSPPVLFKNKDPDGF